MHPSPPPLPATALLLPPAPLPSSCPIVCQLLPSHGTAGAAPGLPPLLFLGGVAAVPTVCRSSHRALSSCLPVLPMPFSSDHLPRGGPSARRHHGLLPRWSPLGPWLAATVQTAFSLLCTLLLPFLCLGFSASGEPTKQTFHRSSLGQSLDHCHCFACYALG